jgi:FkbM family methyltransferase
MTIQAGKRWIKGTSFENSQLVGFLYRLITKLGFGQNSSIVRFGEIELEMDTNDRSMAPGLRNGTYEQDEILFFKSELRPGTIVLDVGANIGLYSLIAAKIIGSDGKVFAFEPSIEAQHLLNANAVRNRLSSCIHLVPKAVSSQKGALHLFIDEDQLGSSSAFRKTSKSYHVETTSIDDFCTEHKIMPSFVKIDIEGGELEALKGAQSLRDCTLMFEHNPVLQKSFGRSPDELLDYVFSRFKKVSVVAKGGKLKPLNTKNDLSSSVLVNLVVRV